MPNCENCIKICPQANMAYDIAKGRLYATQELCKIVKEIENGGLVHVVRCRDCKYRRDSIRCDMYSEGMKTSDDWFCADGERSDSE